MTETQYTLKNLREVPLDPRLEVLLDRAEQKATGSANWKSRKSMDAREILALCQLSRRATIRDLDMSVALRMLVEIRVPVPCRPGGTGPLKTSSHALLGMIYTQDAMVKKLPGTSFVQVLAPTDVWHPNVRWGHPQMLCMGISLPPNTPLKEILLLAYGALCLQNVQVDERSKEGVLNAEAASWWQSSQDLIPLSREAFLQR